MKLLKNIVWILIILLVTFVAYAGVNPIIFPAVRNAVRCITCPIETCPIPSGYERVTTNNTMIMFLGKEVTSDGTCLWMAK